MPCTAVVNIASLCTRDHCGAVHPAHGAEYQHTVVHIISFNWSGTISMCVPPGDGECACDRSVMRCAVLPMGAIAWVQCGWMRSRRAAPMTRDSSSETVYTGHRFLKTVMFPRCHRTLALHASGHSTTLLSKWHGASCRTGAILILFCKRAGSRKNQAAISHGVPTDRSGQGEWRFTMQDIKEAGVSRMRCTRCHWVSHGRTDR